MRRSLAPTVVALTSLMVLLSSAGSASRRGPDPVIVRKKGLVLTSGRTIEGKDYEILARVGATCRSTSINESDPDLAARCSDRLVSPALDLKADAVLGLHSLPTPFSESDLGSKFPSGVSGIAVRTMAGGATGSTHRVPFVVAVPPLEMPDSLKNEKKPKDRLKLIREVALAWAEERGYYAEAVEAVDADSSSLAAMSAEAWAHAFGPWAGAVLSTRLVIANATSAMLGQREKLEVTVEARLFSADSARVLWTRAADGRYANWISEGPWNLQNSGAFVISTGVSNSVRVQIALSRAVRQAIAAAPPAN